MTSARAASAATAADLGGPAARSGAEGDVGVTADIAAILAMDGLANGAVYLLAGLGLVLVFSVTRVVFVPFGDVAAFSALSLAAFETGRTPPTIGLVATLAALAVATEVASLVRRGETARIPRALLLWGVLPLVPCALAWLAAQPGVPAPLHVASAVLLVVPVAPLLARVVFQPIADASVLVLLIVALALHFLLSGLGLLFFGPEGSRTAAARERHARARRRLHGVGPGRADGARRGRPLGALLSRLRAHVAGKALRATAVNRIGARLVGIRPARTALLAYGCASLLGGLIGVLIAPVTTMYYDSGFIIGLKAFVAAIIGGLTSYPLHGVRRARGRPGRELRVVLERRAQGRDRLLAADPGAAAALVRAAAREESRRRSREEIDAVEPRRTTRTRSCWSRRWSPRSRSRRSSPGSFTVSLLNDIGIGALVALGLVLLTGVGGATSFGQAAFVGIGAYATAWLTTAHGAVAVARAAVRARAHRRVGARHRRAHAAPRRPLPAALDDRLGPVDRDRLRQPRSARPPHRHRQRSGAGLGPWSLADPRAMYYLIWALVGAGAAVRAQRARLAPRPRDARPARRRDPARERRRRRVPRAPARCSCIAALLAGLAGWLYAHKNRFVSPSPFDVRASIEYLLMAVAGGLGQLTGAIVGAAVVLLLKNALQDVLPLLSSARGAARGGGVRGAVHRAAALRARRGHGLRRPLVARAGSRTAPVDDAALAAAAPLPRRTLPGAGTPIARGRRRDQALRRPRRRQRRQLRRRRRRDRRPDRPERRRQVDDVQPRSPARCR